MRAWFCLLYRLSALRSPSTSLGCVLHGSLYLMKSGCDCWAESWSVTIYFFRRKIVVLRSLICSSLMFFSFLRERIVSAMVSGSFGTERSLPWAVIGRSILEVTSSPVQLDIWLSSSCLSRSLVYTLDLNLTWPISCSRF